MSPILAKQLIYTRIEEAYSPTNKSGYQIYYCSSGIKQNSVTNIVNNISDFEPHTNEIKRWQCFFLENKTEVVLSVTQVIDSHPEIIDKDSRPNILIAHCLVFKFEDYLALDCNPFSVFEQFQFVSSAQNLIETYNQSQNLEKEALFSLQTQDILSQKNIAKLVALGAPESSKNTFLVLGEDIQIYDLVKSIFLSIPVSYRMHLSFDTYIRGRKIQPGEFWVVGSHEWKPGYSRIINANSQDFDIVLTPSKDLYILWVEANNNWADFYELLPEIQYISDAFSFRRRIDENRISERSLDSFYTLHRDYIYKKVLATTNRLIGENISSRFLPFYESKYVITDFISTSSTENINPRKLAKYIKEWFLSIPSEINRLTKEDWKVLKSFSINAKDNVLTYWTAIFTGDKKTTAHMIGVLSLEEYREALGLLKRPLSPISLYIANYCNEFTSYISDRIIELSEEEYVNIVHEIIDHQTELPNSFYSYVLKLGNKELTNLEKLVSKKKTSAEFNMAIKTRRSQLGQPHTIFDNIFGRK